MLCILSSLIKFYASDSSILFLSSCTMSSFKSYLKSDLLKNKQTVNHVNSKELKPFLIAVRCTCSCTLSFLLLFYSELPLFHLPDPIVLALKFEKFGICYGYVLGSFLHTGLCTM